MISLNGLTPLEFNNPISGLTKPDEKPRDPELFDRENYLKKLYTNGDGRAIIPKHVLKGVIKSATKFSTMKPPGRFKSWMPLVKSCLLIEDDIKLEYSDKQLGMHKAVVSLDPSKGTRSPRGFRHWPTITCPWSGGTKIMVTDDALTKSALEELCDIGGRVCGFMEGREAFGFGRANISLMEFDK